MGLMKRVMQIKLTPGAAQAEVLDATMQRFNAACNWVAERAFERQLANRFKLHKLYYYDVRQTFDLPANFACAVFARVAATMRRDKRAKLTFKPHASLPYDARLLRFLSLNEVSLTTLDGRIRVGMVMGVVNIATDSDGDVHSGTSLARARMRYGRLRARLQRAAATAASRMTRKRIHRKVKRIRRREPRFARDVNHVISRRLVAKAEGTGRGIALENLKGIRDRTRFRKRQRGLMSSWSFDQLRRFVEYKACLAAVLCVAVDPRNTSRECSVCGHVAKSNRQNQVSLPMWQVRPCGQCRPERGAEHSAPGGCQPANGSGVRPARNKPPALAGGR